MGNAAAKTASVQEATLAEANSTEGGMQKVTDMYGSFWSLRSLLLAEGIEEK